MSAAPLEDDADPTYSHFHHRDAFLSQLATFLSSDISHSPSADEDKVEEEQVTALGSMVSATGA